MKSSLVLTEQCIHSDFVCRVRINCTFLHVSDLKTCSGVVVSGFILQPIFQSAGSKGTFADIVYLVYYNLLYIFPLEHMLALSQHRCALGALTQPGTSHCLSNYITPHKGLPASYPIPFPTQTQSLLVIQSFSSPVEYFLTCTKSQTRIKQQHDCIILCQLPFVCVVGK